MSDITVVIPVSPIKSHPDTSIIEECIATVRHHLPTAEVLLTFDGVHPSQEHFTERYNEFKTRMLWKCLHEYQNVLPLVFDEHRHQSGMMKVAMEYITTPLILYVEGDTMLTTDRELSLNACRRLIYGGDAYTVRFHFEASIPDEHRHMIIGEPDNGFLRTFQWSQRPHLSSKAYYEHVLAYFPDDACSFIEDEWHGVVIRDYERDGLMGWYKHRLWIYYPEGDIKRSYTRDGRQGEPKVGEGFKK